MSSLNKFGFLLKTFYFISKFSGFLYISVNFYSSELEMTNKTVDLALFLVSLLISVYANFHPGYLPIGKMIPSKILEIGVNLTIKGFLIIICIVKIACFIQRSKLFLIVSKINKLNTKVRIDFFTLGLKMTLLVFEVLDSLSLPLLKLRRQFMI